MKMMPYEIVDLVMAMQVGVVRCRKTSPRYPQRSLGLIFIYHKGESPTSSSLQCNFGAILPFPRVIFTSSKGGVNVAQVSIH